jgi:large subunit ribosomal protein L10
VEKGKKEQIINELVEAFRDHKTFYLVDFKQMPVWQSVELRKTLRKHSFRLKVVKNRLALRALGDQAPESLKPYFERPTAVVFASENPIGLARLLKDFSAQNKVLAVKGGMVEGRFLAGERFDEIAKLTSRDDLLAKFGYLMAYPLMKLLRTLGAPLNNFGSLLGQLKNKE